jgi:FixJ family two-component response regulator
MAPLRKNDSAVTTVFVLDDDPSVRKALVRVLRASGYEAAAYDGVDTFVQQAEISCTSCIISDIEMAGTRSTALPVLLADRGLKIPDIFVTACDTDVCRTAAKRAGATGYFRKPIDGHALIDAIKWVLA